MKAFGQIRRGASEALGVAAKGTGCGGPRESDEIGCLERGGGGEWASRALRRIQEKAIGATSHESPWEAGWSDVEGLLSAGERIRWWDPGALMRRASRRFVCLPERVMSPS